MSNNQAPSADLYENRLGKLEELQKEGYDPYSFYFLPKDTAANLAQIAPKNYTQDKQYSIAGRIRSYRLMGKAAFCDLEDHSGRFQLYTAKDSLKEKFKVFQKLDLGDIIGVSGFLFQTRTGQSTLHVLDLVLLAKCLRPLPVVKEAGGKVFDAFSDQEQRYRQRYVDLIVNPSVRQNFITRSRLVSEIRSFLLAREYIEVETPAMQPIPGGAAARPFVTHHNTLDMQLYLRVAPELYLKRLIVGGFPKVFEIGRNFRNEGISPKHNPEFTMLELYETYGNIDTMLVLCQELISSVIKKICGTWVLEYGSHKLNFKPPWKRMSYIQAIQEFSNIDDFDLQRDLKESKKAAKQAKIPTADIDACDSPWQLAEILFDKCVEPQLIQPTFIVDYPRELSPLAKSWPKKPELVQRFEPYIAGREIGNAFSELNDPLEQKRRFLKQQEERRRANEAGAEMDHDYVRALEYGMPPTGGLGIGIDRLAMLLTNAASIRDTILFPLLRPEH